MTAAPKLGTATIGSVRGLDRMSEKRADPDWVAAKLADPASRFLLLVELKLVTRPAPGGGTAIRWFAAEEIAALGIEPAETILLGCEADGAARFAASINAGQAVRLTGGSAEPGPLVELRALAVQGALGPHELAIVGEARAVAAWHDGHRCCGRCGAHTRNRDAGWRRQCWACRANVFPRADPAVITLVSDGERCLLAHHRRFKEPRYTVLAGFVEPGEDIEDAVRREIREESGIEVGEVHYLGSQPWPFPHSLMLGCWAQALTTDICLDNEELTHAIWASRDEAAAIIEGRHPKGFVGPGPFSIAYMLIRCFADGG